MTNPTNRPTAKFRDGGVQLDVWNNAREDGSHFPTFSFTRRYRDANGDWQDSNSWTRTDAMKLQQLISIALERTLPAVNGDEQ